jgi:hypothetical protein
MYLNRSNPLRQDGKFGFHPNRSIETLNTQSLSKLNELGIYDEAWDESARLFLKSMLTEFVEAAFQREVQRFKRMSV